ncbi:serine hydrolase [Streptomyces actinomycinicus]|uniref:Serine hydrolase n=1 Tax=Streptomyces actinomycinicus TaxID=1695166 RepID=A0A937EJ81_9ACTN|nr:serine hydrolase [Streptomyces actinomycinicus]MBL1083387.1 serine hydrolase [Streptomyces actinomycinicus]
MTGPSGVPERPANQDRPLPSRRDFLAGSLGVGAAFTVLPRGFSARRTAGPPGGARADVQSPFIQPWVARHDLTADQYQAEFRRLDKENYRLLDVCGYQAGEGARFAAIWEQRPGPEQFSLHAIPLAEYAGVFDGHKDDFQLVRLNGYNIAGNVFFAAIWDRRTGEAPKWWSEEYSDAKWWSRHDVPDSELRSVVDEREAKKYRLVDISAYPGQDFRGTRFAMIWELADGRHWGYISPRVREYYQQAFEKVVQQDYRPARVSAFLPGGAGQTAYYTAALEKSVKCAFVARHGIDTRMYQHEVEHAGRSYRPVFVGGFTADYGGGKNATPGFCPVWRRCEAGAVMPDLVDACMKKLEIPGLSVAFAHQGGLVYAQGFGTADKDTGEKVTDASLFRIASVTKTITSTAVMTLAETGQLSLADTVFGPRGLLGTTFGKQPYGTGIESITVQNLLEHTAGPGWSNQIPDPVYEHPEMNQAQLISWVLDQRPLNNAAGTGPGTEFAYSNFGYIVLGRIIERVTRRPYEEYVSRQILAPCGITGMRIAGNTRADRRPGEVAYYDQNKEDPYGSPITRKDAEGGWLGTATDLMRFVTRVDGFGAPPDILSSASIQTMTTPSTAKGANGYAKGWAVHPATQTWWHTGNLAGSSSVLVRTRHGFCWAALANTRRMDTTNRSDAAKNTEAALYKLLWDIHDQVDAWPEKQGL